MFEMRLAYGFQNGEIEGFQGIGFEEETALNDCFAQIRKKLTIIKEEYNGKNVIDGFYDLTKEQIKNIKADWNSNLRY